MERRTKPKAPPEYGVPDDENPEWTEADFRRARPVREVMPELIEAAKRARGRPKLARPKAHVSLRVDPDVLAAYKASGPGWQKRINDILARAIGRKRNARTARPAKVARNRKSA